MRTRFDRCPVGKPIRPVAVRAINVGKPDDIMFRAWMCLVIRDQHLCSPPISNVFCLFLRICLCWKRQLLYWKDVHIILAISSTIPIDHTISDLRQILQMPWCHTKGDSDERSCFSTSAKRDDAAHVGWQWEEKGRLGRAGLSNYNVGPPFDSLVGL